MTGPEITNALNRGCNTIRALMERLEDATGKYFNSDDPYFLVISDLEKVRSQLLVDDIMKEEK